MVRSSHQLHSLFSCTKKALIRRNAWRRNHWRKCILRIWIILHFTMQSMNQFDEDYWFSTCYYSIDLLISLMPPEIDWGSETTCKVMIANTIKILTSRAILQSKKVSLVHQYQICHHKNFYTNGIYQINSYLILTLSLCHKRLTENSIHQSVFTSFLRVIYSYRWG